MSWKRTIKEENLQEFSRNEGGSQMLIAPRFVGDDNRYEIYDILSVSGGFGIIYKARDTRLNGHEVLIKSRRYDEEPGLFLNKNDISTKTRIEEMRAKFEFEAECLILFKQNRESRMPILNDYVYGFSPSIYGPHVDIHGNKFCITDEYVYEEPYIVMQVINGTNLWDIVKCGIPELCEKRGYICFFEWERCVLEYIKELTTIFSGFHKEQSDEKGDYYYIYQDLKPENIILSFDKFLTLLDFGGITKIRIKKDINGLHNGMTETVKGNPGLGTFGFQAPEARKNVSNLDLRCDIYTLGATMFQLLTGFSMTDILLDEDEPLPLEACLKGVCSDSTYEVMQTCLQRDREKRYKSMKEIREVILNRCFRDVKLRIREYM